MRTILSVAVAVAVLSGGGVSAGSQGQARGVKVFISVDMEGLTGVTLGSEVSATGADYAHFRAIMAGETNAAIEGAQRGGATEIVVRDSHGNKTNLLPADVTGGARLIRGPSTGPKNMMEGIDETFDAAVFIGYHARAGTPDAVLAHTSNGNVVDVSINGVSLPEAGYNALVAGLYNVPVAFVAGDQAFVDQARALLGPVEALAVKRVISGGAVDHLEVAHARRLIRDGVERGIRGRDRVKPYKLSPPYTMVLKVRAERPLYKGATRTATGTSTFQSPDLFEVLNAFNAMK